MYYNFMGKKQILKPGIQVESNNIHWNNLRLIKPVFLNIYILLTDFLLCKWQQ